MQKWLDVNRNHLRHLRSLWAVIAIVSTLCIVIGIGWILESRTIRISLPPDLRSGATLQANQIHPWEVYSFAVTMFQLVTSWREEEGFELLNQYRHFLTDNFIELHRKRLSSRQKRGELMLRAKQMTLITSYSDQLVEVLGNSWIVRVKFAVVENLRGQQIKEKQVEYSIKVVRKLTHPQFNPWGLVLDV